MLKSNRFIYTKCSEQLYFFLQIYKNKRVDLNILHMSKNSCTILEQLSFKQIKPNMSLNPGISVKKRNMLLDNVNEGHIKK